MRIIAIISITLFFGCLSINANQSEEIIVNHLYLHVANDGECSLAEAINTANTGLDSGDASGECEAVSSETIIIQLPGTIFIDDIGLRNIHDQTLLPVITSSIVILGTPTTLAESDEHPQYRFFEVAETGSLTLDNVLLYNGSVEDSGGAILNHGTTIISSSAFRLNTANNGGAIMNYGDIAINAGAFLENEALESDDGTADIGYGGAVYSLSSLVNIYNSLFYENIADNGGAVASIGNLIITNTEFNHNIATNQGEAIYTNGITILESLTYNENTAMFGDNISYQGFFRIYNEGIINPDSTEDIFNNE